MFSRNILCALAIFCCFCAKSSETITLFGKFGKANYDQYGLRVSLFDQSNFARQPTERQKIDVCESINDSSLICLGWNCPYSLLFTEPYTEKLRAFLERGGILYIDC